jgi:CheY-like chemotaxis protein
MTIVELRPFTRDLSILVVEDEEPARQALVSIFGRIFASVDSAVDGKEGLEIYLANPTKYDIILTDISMPRMSGTEMIEQIRKENNTIPIIVLSAHNESSRLIELINAGADSFLQKPLGFDSQVDMIYRLAIRACDAKMIRGYILQLEEQNALLLKWEKKIEIQDHVITTKIWQANQQAVDALVENKSIVTQEIEVDQTQEQEPPQPRHDNADYHSLLIDDDVMDLVDLVADIENYVLLTFQGAKINEDYIDHLVRCFQKFGTIIYRYPMFGALAGSVFNLSTGIDKHRATFVEKQDFVVPFLENLVFVIEKYVADVWKKTASNPHFYDASMINDIETFLAIIGGEEQSVSNAEDLLEFF